MGETAVLWRDFTALLFFTLLQVNKYLAQIDLMSRLYLYCKVHRDSVYRQQQCRPKMCCSFNGMGGRNLNGPNICRLRARSDCGKNETSNPVIIIRISIVTCRQSGNIESGRSK